MKNRLCVLSAILLSSAATQAQDFLGLSTGNYAGVTGVMLQPASIVDSRHKFDINLVSISANFDNNMATVDKDAIYNFDINNYKHFRTFKQKYMEYDPASGERGWINAANRTQLPLSFMVTLGKKSALALNLQSRSMVQARNISNSFGRLAFNDFYTSGNPLDTINASGYAFDALNWASAGLTFGRVLLNNDKHFVKAAITANYLGGLYSFNMGSDDFKLSVNPDSSFNIHTTNHRYNHNNGADFDKIFNKNFRPDVNSWGFDAGLVYEFRGNIEKFRSISRDDSKSYVEERRDQNKYMFKLGVSLLDVGKFQFQKPQMVRNFNGDILAWDIRDAQYQNINDFDTALAIRTTPAGNDERNYTVHLPTALSVQFDLRLVKGFYINAMAYRPVEMGGKEGMRWNDYGYYAVTPRWESRNIGVYIPYSFKDYKSIEGYENNKLGATLRLGPVFVGSSNIGNVLFNDKLRSADVHVGLKVGFTYGKPNKASKILQSLTGEEPKTTSLIDTAFVNGDTVIEKKIIKDGRVIESRRERPNGTLIDYKNGRIHTSDEGNKGNIIIINNYYGKDGEPREERRIERRTIIDSTGERIMYEDSTFNGRGLRRNYPAERRVDTLYIQNRMMQDSLERKSKRLDSLIRNMEEMNRQLDSANQTRLYYNQRIDSLNTAYARAINSNDSATAIRLASEKAILVQEQKSAEVKKKSISQREIDRRMLEDYRDESRRLRNEVADLRDRMEYNNRFAERERNTIVNVPAAQPEIKTVYIRDTVYLTQTTPGKTIVVKDTVVKTVTDEKLVVVEGKVDYSKMPPEVILFDVGKSYVKPIYFKRLDFIAGLLKKDPAAIAEIQGHTDKTGNAAINQALSEKRAGAVKTQLINRGIKTQQLSTKAFSSADPVAEGNDKIALSQNRRVTIKIGN